MKGSVFASASYGGRAGHLTHCNKQNRQSLRVHHCLFALCGRPDASVYVWHGVFKIPTEMGHAFLKTSQTRTLKTTHELVSLRVRMFDAQFSCVSTLLSSLNLVPHRATFQVHL